MDCLFKEQEDGLGGMDPFEEGFEEDPEPEPEWADSDIEEVLPTVTTQSKRNLLFEVHRCALCLLCCAVFCHAILCYAMLCYAKLC